MFQRRGADSRFDFQIRPGNMHELFNPPSKVAGGLFHHRER